MNLHSYVIYKAFGFEQAKPRAKECKGFLGSDR
jgi:hypothetical protein